MSAIELPDKNYPLLLNLTSCKNVLQLNRGESLSAYSRGLSLVRADELGASLDN